MINTKLASIYKSKVQRLIRDVETNKINRFCEIIKKTSKKNKILVFGNGGSASTANHFANDMTKNAKIKTFSFSNDNLITCYSNDYGFENWIKKALEHYGSKNDLCIFISASGNSKNVVKAAKFCKKLKIKSYSLTGFKKNNQLNKISDNSIWIKSNSYNQIEIIHHMILLTVVDILIGKDNYKSNL